MRCKSLNKEILKKVQQIDIRLRRKVHSLFSGSYRSAFKGQGMIFSDVRAYVPGDDIRSISWNLTAKMSKPYIKTFEEDREAQIILAVDISASMDFGTSPLSKRSVLNLLSSVIAFCANKNKDLLGLLLFSSDVELYVPPKKGAKHSFRVVREICGFKRLFAQTDLNKSLAFLHKVLKKKSHIFIFSDFLSSSFQKSMSVLEQKHDVVNIVISDIFERQIPSIGLVDVEDIETGEQRTIDFSSPIFRKQLKTELEEKIKKRNSQFTKTGADKIFIDCDKDIYQPLIDFFHKRKSQKKQVVSSLGVY